MAQVSETTVSMSTELAISSTDLRLNWLMLWSISPTGECCCPKGSRHRAPGDKAIGWTTDCSQSPGKHPWSVWRDSVQVGYVHGSKDADKSQAAAIEKYGPLGGLRRWGITLKDIVLVDLDNERAIRDFRRIIMHIPASKFLGIARTPRGWHVYLDCPGFTQRSLNLFLRRWLDDWDGTDEAKVSRRGYLLDFRTGENRYAVWPAGDRYWASPRELFTDMARVAGQIPAHRLKVDGSAAPWNLVRTPELEKEIEAVNAAASRITVVKNADGSIHQGHAVSELSRWCRQLAAMGPDSGRNSMLNKIAFFAGSRAIRAGIPEQTVRDRLEQAAIRCGMQPSEIEPTINSGLRSGTAKLAQPA